MRLNEAGAGGMRWGGVGWGGVGCGRVMRGNMRQGTEISEGASHVSVCCLCAAYLQLQKAALLGNAAGGEATGALHHVPETPLHHKTWFIVLHSYGLATDVHHRSTRQCCVPSACCMCGMCNYRCAINREPVYILLYITSKIPCSAF